MGMAAVGATVLLVKVRLVPTVGRRLAWVPAGATTASVVPAQAQAGERAMGATLG